jgi:hypothetical protein
MPSANVLEARFGKCCKHSGFVSTSVNQDVAREILSKLFQANTQQGSCKYSVSYSMS